MLFKSVYCRSKGLNVKFSKSSFGVCILNEIIINLRNKTTTPENTYYRLGPLKDKKGITIVNAFQKVISKGRKPDKIWVDQGGEFHNKPFKRFLS